MPVLERLNLGWCVRLADGSLHAIGKGCPSLQYLYLLGNTNMCVPPTHPMTRDRFFPQNLTIGRDATCVLFGYSAGRQRASSRYLKDAHGCAASTSAASAR